MPGLQWNLGGGYQAQAREKPLAGRNNASVFTISAEGGRVDGEGNEDCGQRGLVTWGQDGHTSVMLGHWAEAFQGPSLASPFSSDPQLEK